MPAAWGASPQRCPAPARCLALSCSSGLRPVCLAAPSRRSSPSCRSPCLWSPVSSAVVRGVCVIQLSTCLLAVSPLFCKGVGNGTCGLAHWRVVGAQSRLLTGGGHGGVRLPGREEVWWWRQSLSRGPCVESQRGKDNRTESPLGKGSERSGRGGRFLGRQGPGGGTLGHVLCSVLSLSIDIGAGLLCAVGLPCAMWEDRQHPWPPSTGLQKHHRRPSVMPKCLQTSHVSRDQHRPWLRAAGLVGTGVRTAVRAEGYAAARIAIFIGACAGRLLQPPECRCFAGEGQDAGPPSRRSEGSGPLRGSLMVRGRVTGR